MYGVGGADAADNAAKLARDGSVTAARKTRRKCQIGLVESRILPLRAEIGRSNRGSAVYRTHGVIIKEHGIHFKARPIK